MRKLAATLGVVTAIGAMAWSVASHADWVREGKSVVGNPRGKTDREWKKILSSEQYGVMRCSLTEAPFSGKYWNHHEKGVYQCAACDAILFDSSTKFDSQTGWPSFFQAFRKDRVIEKEDKSYGMRRIEILCSRCRSHLGHVFPDGPKPTGLRYCINSLALKFEKQ